MPGADAILAQCVRMQITHPAIEHLGALDLVYSGVIGDHRTVIAATEEIDPVTEDLLVDQSGQLEKFHWFVRAHLESSGGQLSTAGASSEVGAADQAAAREA